MNNPARQVIIDLYKAYATRDAEKIGSFFHEDAVWVAPKGNATQIALGMDKVGDGNLNGRAVISRFMAVNFGRLFISDVSNDFVGIYADGDHVTVEHRLSAKLVNGRHYVNDYCFVFDVKDGKVIRMREYMDTFGGFTQIFGDDEARVLIEWI